MSAQGEKIAREIMSHESIFDFDKNGLGEDLCLALAIDVMYAMEQESSPIGDAWQELSDAYEEWKSTHFPGQPISVLLGYMRTIPQLYGEKWITPKLMKQTYGLDELARQLAAWFQEGNDNQPPRPFYMIGPRALRAYQSILERRARQAIR